MAKIKGPLFSISASGSLGPRLIYQKRTTGSQVRFQKAQADVLTDDRTIERGYYTEAVAHWNTLTTGQQQEWSDFNNSV